MTLLVPDVTPIMDGDDGMPSSCPLPLSGTGPSCVVVGTGYITTMYTSTVHLYTVQSIYRTMSPMHGHGSLGQIYIENRTHRTHTYMNTYKDKGK